MGQVNKLVEIQGLEIYCRTVHGSSKDLYIGNGENSMSIVAANFHSDEHIHLLAPVDVSASLSVCYCLNYSTINLQGNSGIF